MGMLQQASSSNPELAQAIKMFQNGNPQEVVQNLMREKGISKDQLNGMLSQFGIKL